MAELYFARFNRDERFTHYIFRFPAKFHTAAVRCLVDRYSKRGEKVLDPFCGSGTLLLEAQLAGRSAVGVDVDPVAAFISRVKCAKVNPNVVERSFASLRGDLDDIRRSSREYDRLVHEDLTPTSIARYRRRFNIPQIPNIEHWFRVYVILDLARLRQAILAGPYTGKVRNFFLACLASIIRSASNADPVPVSGLEVTAHMRKLDKLGRRVDPFDLFERRVRREIKGLKELWDDSEKSSVRVRRGDATRLSRILSPESFDVCITSPPYNTAVDYYRRHTLEMYWLDFVQTHEEKVKLAPSYLGRVQVRTSNKRLKMKFTSDYVNNLLSHARSISRARERTVHHYCASMMVALEQIARVLKPRGRAVFVVGNAKWNGRSVRATKVLRELSKGRFTIDDSLSYASRNRYMSYERRNGANVNREYVLILRKK
jgi:DNA modification methylase